MNKVTEAHLNAKTQALENLLNEIEKEGYTSIEQVKASILLDLRILTDLMKEHNDE